jgi:hypothetical protein
LGPTSSLRAALCLFTARRRCRLENIRPVHAGRVHALFDCSISRWSPCRNKHGDVAERRRLQVRRGRRRIRAQKQGRGSASVNLVHVRAQIGIRPAYAVTEALNPPLVVPGLDRQSCCGSRDTAHMGRSVRQRAAGAISDPVPIDASREPPSDTFAVARHDGGLHLRVVGDGARLNNRSGIVRASSAALDGRLARWRRHRAAFSNNAALMLRLPRFAGL